MHNEGFSTMCGHGIIAVVTIALERGLIVPRRPGVVVLDAPAGQIRARADVMAATAGVACRACRFENVPSFVLHAGVPVRLGRATLRVDVAFGGAFYAIVDAKPRVCRSCAERLTRPAQDRDGDQARGRGAR